MSGNRGNDSDDDFQSNSTNKQKNANINIPVGHILCAPKWKNTPITAKLSGKFGINKKAHVSSCWCVTLFSFLETIKVLYSPGLGVVDFHPSSDCAIVFVSAAELVEGLQYKKRLATLRNLKDVRKIVVGERTPVSLQHYNTLQHFAVIELDLNLIPVSDNCLPAFLTQTVKFIYLWKFNFYII